MAFVSCVAVNFAIVQRAIAVDIEFDRSMNDRSIASKVRKAIDRSIRDGSISMKDGVAIGDRCSPANGKCGVVAMRGVEKATRAIAVKQSRVISIANVDEELRAVANALRVERGGDDVGAMMLTLMYEKYELGERSKFWDDIRTFPEEYDCATFWSEGNARELSGSDSLEYDVAEEYAKVRAVWRGLTKNVFDVYKDVFKNSAVRSWHATRWAWTTTHARARRVRGLDGLAIVPVIDMMHECAGNESTSGDDEANEDLGHAVYDHHSDSVVVYARRSYAPGEEVCGRFGGLNNFDSIQHLGYLPNVDESDPRNCALFVMKARDEFKEKVTNAGFATPWRACVSANSRNQSLDMLAAFIELAEGRDVKVSADGVPYEVPKNALLEYLKIRIGRYPTTLADDATAIDDMRESVNDFNERLASDDLEVLERAQMEIHLANARRGVLAVEFRMREKKILAALVKRVEAELTSAASSRDEL